MCVQRFFMSTTILRSFSFFLLHVYHHVRVVVVSVKQLSNYLFFLSRNAQPPSASHIPHPRISQFLLPLAQKEPPSLPCIHCANLLHSYRRTHHLCIHRVRHTNFCFIFLLPIETFDEVVPESRQQGPWVWIARPSNRNSKTI